ncbi:cbb3-type cytochrome c oxidase subunit I [Pyxidicoccus sp. 3LG]
MADASTGPVLARDGISRREEAPPSTGPVLSRDGVLVASFALRESVRPDARREVQALQAEGLGVWLISGDAPPRAQALAASLGIPSAHALGGQRPEDKATTVASLDSADTLYLGDGVNDSLAFERALCAGTPAIDRPVLPGKSDFFLLGEGLFPIREALRLAPRLQRVVRRLLVLAVAYNAVAVTVCLAGWMTPLRAAFAMPATSLATVLKFLIAGVTFYGMATFEGPLLSIKSVSALGHYTDWIVGHVHSGALGWNGFMAAGMFYWLVPRLYGTKLHSTKAADAHFWLGTVGILLYMVSMWISGVTQGLMWRALNPDGTLLYPNFVETLLAIRPMYIVRFAGGSMYLVGFIMMAWNLWKTARAGQPVNGETTVVVEEQAPAPVGAPVPGWVQVVTGRPLVFAIAILTATMFLGWAKPVRALVLMGGIIALGEFAWIVTRREREAGKPSWFGLIEGRPLAFTVLTLVAILIGGVAELLPTLLIKQAVPAHGQAQQPYSPLECPWACRTSTPGCSR